MRFIGPPVIPGRRPAPGPESITTILSISREQCCWIPARTALRGLAGMTTILVCPRIAAAINQQILPRDVAGLRGAKKRAVRAEFARLPESPRRILRDAPLP